jgi:iron(III) transport system substrate-binding protein
VNRHLLSRRDLLARGVSAGAGLVVLGGAACANTAVPSSATSSSGATPSSAASGNSSALVQSSPAPSSAPAAAQPSPGVSASPSSTGAAADNSALIAAARQEGTVTYYTAQADSANNALAALLKDRYGIEVQIVRLVTNNLNQRYAAEAKANNVVADVVSSSDALFMDQATAQGWLAPVAGVPTLASWPAQFQTPTYIDDAVSPYGMVWNTQQVQPGDEPHVWQDVLDPRWKGQLLIGDPRNSNGTLAFFGFLRDTYGDDFLRQLAALAPRLSDTLQGGTQQIAAGASALLIPTITTNVVDIVKQGGPIKDFYPDQTTGSLTVAGISAKAPHPNAARLLLNVAMTVDGQAALSQGGVALLPNVPNATPLPKQFVPAKLQQSLDASGTILSLLGIS